MEAHAEDTWPLGCDVRYNQTHTTEERCKVARDFIEQNDYPFTLRIDEAPSNTFNEVFAAWPLRFYVLDNGRILYIHEPEGDSVFVSTLMKYLGYFIKAN